MCDPLGNFVELHLCEPLVFNNFDQSLLDIHVRLFPESNATILALSVKNVKLDSYEKLSKTKFR